MRLVDTAACLYGSHSSTSGPWRGAWMRGREMFITGLYCGLEGYIFASISHAASSADDRAPSNAKYVCVVCTTNVSDQRSGRDGRVGRVEVKHCERITAVCPELA